MTTSASDEASVAGTLRRVPKPLPANTKSDLWVVSVAADDDRQLTADQVKEAIRQGEIGGETLVWRAGLRDWTPLSSFADLALVLAMSQGVARRPSAAPAVRAPSTAPPVEHPAPSSPATEPPVHTPSTPVQDAPEPRIVEPSARLVATPPGERVVRLEPGKPILEDVRTPAKPLLDAEAIAGLFSVDVEPVPLSSGTLLSGREERKIVRRAAPRPPRPMDPGSALAAGSVLEEDLDFSIDSAPPSSDRRGRAAGTKPARSRDAMGPDAMRPPSMRVLMAPAAEGRAEGRRPAVPARAQAGEPGPARNPVLLWARGVSPSMWLALGIVLPLFAVVLWLLLRPGPEATPAVAMASATSGSAADPAPAAIDSVAPPVPLPAPPDSSPPSAAESEPTAKPKVTARGSFVPGVGRTDTGGASKPQGDTDNAGGPPFDTAAAATAMQNAASLATACRKGDDPAGTALVIVTFAPSGRVTSATVSGKPFAGTATGGCIAAAMRRVTVPPFGGARVTVSKRVPVH